MLRRVIIGSLQKVTREDFNNFGDFPQQTFDQVLADVGPGLSFTGFPVVASGPAEVTVGAGSLYLSNGEMYFNDQESGTAIDMLPLLPVVTRRVVAITVWGQEIETDTEPRTFLVDASTRAAQARVVSTERRRHVNIGTAAGIEGPDPGAPAVPANTLVVAYVTLDTTGIVSIAVPTQNRTPSIRDLNLRLNENDLWRGRIGTRIDTLGTDLANLAGRLDGTARQSFVLELARDNARIKEAINLPDNYTSWGADHFLTVDESDPTHADWLAKVEEGIRFPNAAERNAQVALLNPFEERVIAQNNFILPRYVETPRLEVLGNDTELSISQYEHQTITWRQLARTRMRVRWGTPFTYCTNSAWWWDNGVLGGYETQQMRYDPVRNILIRPATGETFQILSATPHPGGHADHYIYRLQQFWVDEIVDSYYWERVVTNQGLNGSIIAQTFLNTQDGWLTSAEIFLTRVGASGDVHVLITETINGAPDFTRVIARVTVPRADLKTYPQATKAGFVPTLLQQGKRYALVIQTPGNHFAALVTGNKFAQGSLFTSTDGAWAQGDLQRDLTMRLNFARFDATRVAVELTPIELENGIAAIDINVDSTRPAACQTIFEVRINGVWTPLQGYSVNPLNGLPPLLPFRVVLLGTTDVMPGIGVGPNGWVLTHRPRADYRHISKVLTLSAPVNRVYVDVRVESWRGGPHHTLVTRLLHGAGYATVLTPSVTQEVADPVDPNARIFKYTFVVTNLSAFRLRIEGTTSNVLTTYHVAERVHVGASV